MRTLFSIAATLLLLSHSASAQSSTPGEQERAGLRMLDALVHEHDSVAWSMIHPELKKLAPSDWIAKFGTQVRSMRSIGGFTPEFLQLAMRLKQDAMGKPAGFGRAYTFKNDTAYPPRFTISVTFADAVSTEVIGLSLNDMPAGPSAMRPGVVRITAMDQDLSGQEGWLVGGDSVAIDGVTLILQPNKKVMMVIKVFRDVESLPDVATRARTEALPIVHYALEQGYRQKATDFMLAYPDMKLSGDIGVAFNTPFTTRMYRTTVTAEEYNAK